MWPENYSANSVQKVWAAKFAARHPNVVVLDLSSFKCGHDAPTYGLIDSIIVDVGDALLGAARHRRQQAGRLDQDPRQDLRPLAEAARGAARGHGASARTSSTYRIDEKRLELLELKQQQLEARKQQDPALEAMIDEIEAKVAAYAAQVEAQAAEVDAGEQAKDAGLVQLGIKKRVDDDEVVARV